MARESILVVEDEDDILELITFNLSKEGYRVRGVASGEDAIDRARTDLPNLILLDLMLPGVDGLDVCKTLRADPKTQHIPIIMLTAKGEEADRDRGLEAGANEYMTKPFSPSQVIQRVTEIFQSFGE